METLNQIMIVCGWIITIGGAAAVVYKTYRGLRKPKEDLEKRISSIENAIKEINKKIDSDYNAINHQEETLNLLVRSVFALIENKITGNNVEGLKKTRDALIEALTEK